MIGRAGRILAGAVLLLPAAAGAASASEVLLSGSFRSDFLYLRRAPESAFRIGDGATNLDSWFDTRVFRGDWEASARLRVHETTRIEGDPSTEEIDRRHIAFRRDDLEVLAGNYYVTFGHGLILRTLEQRFVSLGRMDRAFNLDRNLDGVRLRATRGALRLTALSGTPRIREVSGTGGATELDNEDRIQGAESVVTLLDGRVEGGLAVVRHETPRNGARVDEDLLSYRFQGRQGPLTGSFEFAEKRHLPDTPRGIARYVRLEGTAGPVGWSVEGKSYRHFTFPYNELPSLVRTHDSVLLNRATHVLLPDDERGLQAEILYAPGLFTTVLVNLSGAEGSDDTPGRIFREVYLEGRTERDGLGALRVGLDWARDQTAFPQVDERWTLVLEGERFLTTDQTIQLDLELQPVSTRFGDTTRQLLSIGTSRAGLWTISLTGEHATDPTLTKRDWLFATLDLRLGPHHDLTLGYGSRPAGLVCSGGFCFESPEFDGAEMRLLSRF